MELGWCDTALVLPYAAIQILYPGIADRCFILWKKLNYFLAALSPQVRPQEGAGLLPGLGRIDHLGHLLSSLPLLLHGRPRRHWCPPGSLLAGLHQDPWSLVPRLASQLSLWVDQHCHLLRRGGGHCLGRHSSFLLWLEKCGCTTGSCSFCYGLVSGLSTLHS